MRIRPILRIARWETISGAGGLDRRGAIMAGVALVALAALVPAVASTGVTPDEGLYRVGVDDSSSYRPAVVAEPTLTPRPPDREAFGEGRLDLLILDGRIFAQDSRKGRAAAAAFRGAVEQYNDRLMHLEADQAAAFPVSVQLRYVERDVSLVIDQDRFEDGASEGQSTPIQDGEAGGEQPGSDDGGETVDSTGESGGSTGEGRPSPAGDGSDGSASASGPADAGSSLTGSQALLGRTTGTPSDISPPFPFVSLVLAFAFVVPMNFVIQAYASSVLHERRQRRGELLLMAPISRWTIIAGKTVPYFAAMVAIATVTAVAIGGGLVSLAAVTPIALLFLGAAFVGALMARSHKELTFVLVTVSVIVTTYVFVPAIFTDIHPIAAISPLTMVVRELEGVVVSWGTVIFSTLPVYLAAGVLFMLGGGLYREEDLFTQRRLPAKALDALASPIRGHRSAAVMSALSIPFVFLAELLAVAMLFVLPLSLSLPALLVSLAFIEEVAKSIHIYAGFQRGRYERKLGVAALIGAWSGVGFFLAEKFVIAAQLVGLADLDLGRAAFSLSAGTGGANGLILIALLVAPLLLHAGTAAVTSLGASRDRFKYLFTIVVAVAIHAAYNLAVVMQLG